MEDKKLAALALSARDHAYAPYSGYQVGAALLACSGKVYQGCNIENAAFGPTNCAERTAIFTAVADGEREFEAIAIAGGPKGCDVMPDYASPCGVCRQVMAEFDDGSLRVILVRSEDDYRVYTLRELLPLAFGLENRKEDAR